VSVWDDVQEKIRADCAVMWRHLRAINDNDAEASFLKLWCSESCWRKNDERATKAS
jgi:hypothetical protein